MGIKTRQGSRQRLERMASAVKTLSGIVRAQYEALEHDRLRRRPNIKTDRTETQQVFSGQERLRAYWLSDLLYDNDDIGSTVDTVVRLSIGPKGGNLQFFLDDGASDTANQEKWDSWMKQAGWQEDENFHDLLGMILHAVILHGDCLILCDPDITDGKLRIWDADQICPVMETDFRDFCNERGLLYNADSSAPSHRQVEGAVLDPNGRVLGWFVTHLRNRVSVAIKDATFISRGLGRRVSKHVKLSSYRGEPLVIPSADLSNDTRQLIKSEVSSARNHAELSLVFKRAKASSEISALMNGLLASDGSLSPDVAAASGLPDEVLSTIKAAVTKNDYSSLEGRAAIAEVEPGTEVQELGNASRPSPAIQEWLHALSDLNGKRLGVMSCLSRGRADNSYSSGQIELSISWCSFAELQKILERQVIDYVSGVVCPGAKGLCHWPMQFEIDPAKAEDTYDARLRGGRTTYRELLGPNWKDVFDELALEKAYAKKIGLDNLSFLSTVAGAPLPGDQALHDENSKGSSDD